MERPSIYACSSSGCPWISPGFVTQPQSTLPRLFQVIVPVLAFLKAGALRRHEKHALLLRIAKIGVAFRHREEPVKGGFQLAGDKPVVKGRGQDHNVRLLVYRIDLCHIVLLHARADRVLSSLPATPAAADVHAAQMELRNHMTCFFRSLTKLLCQRRGIPVLSRAAIENDNVFSHDPFSPLLLFQQRHDTIMFKRIASTNI